MANIQNSERRVYLHKSNNVNGSYNEPIMINEKHKDGEPYTKLLEYDTELIIKQLSKILIKKYFILDRPSTCVAKYELLLTIKNAIGNVCEYFDNLQINNNGIKTFENIPCNVERIINKR